ncbi:MAG: serine/threonine protein kinase [Candidatus Nanohaloarchaea archaeon]|jgi:serine/threonine protein kinase
MVKQGKLDSSILEQRSTKGADIEEDSLYFKPAEYRQIIELPGGYTTDIENEYQAMTELHEVAEDLVVKPYFLTDDPEGYVMEYIEGISLNKALNQEREVYNFEEVIEDLHSLGKTIRSEGIPHGDIRNRNFIVEDSGSLKAIDAAGIPEDVESPGVGTLRDQAVIWDIVDINDIIDKIADKTKTRIDAGEYHIETPVQNITQ